MKIHRPLAYTVASLAVIILLFLVFMVDLSAQNTLPNPNLPMLPSGSGGSFVLTTGMVQQLNGSPVSTVIRMDTRTGECAALRIVSGTQGFVWAAIPAGKGNTLSPNGSFVGENDTEEDGF